MKPKTTPNSNAVQSTSSKADLDTANDSMQQRKRVGADSRPVNTNMTSNVPPTNAGGSSKAMSAAQDANQKREDSKTRTEKAERESSASSSSGRKVGIEKNNIRMKSDGPILPTAPKRSNSGGKPNPRKSRAEIKAEKADLISLASAHTGTSEIEVHVSKLEDTKRREEAQASKKDTQSKVSEVKSKPRQKKSRAEIKAEKAELISLASATTGGSDLEIK